MLRTSIAMLLSLLSAAALTGCSVATSLPDGPVDPGQAPRSRPCTSNAEAPVSAAVRATERVAMGSDEFWGLIATLHGSNSDAAYHRLAKRLEGRPLKQLVGFEARMTLALHALDDECRADWYERHDPSGFGFVADDDFLYFRADTVTAGRRTWQRAVRTDTLPWGDTDATEGDGELLLYVTDEAAKHHGVGEEAWIDRTVAAFPLDYETGSAEGWTGPKVAPPP